jgi:hypothetical protein
MTRTHNIVAFAGGSSGRWQVTMMTTVTGEPIASVDRIAVGEADPHFPSAAWTLRGVASNTRYVKRRDVDTLATLQPRLGRETATQAALILIRKSESWWELAQDERLAIFEEESQHTAIGFASLPAIARRLHHSRDLGERFDFLTWFEFAPEHASTFDTMVARLRATKEWCFVEREIDIRLTFCSQTKEPSSSTL